MQGQRNGWGTADAAALGTGQRNLESRLATRYGAAYAVSVKPAPSQGCCLRLPLPFLLQPFWWDEKLPRPGF